MKLWDKGYNVDQQIEQFTVGNDRILDVKLAPYDVKASIAHAQMLAKVELITSEEGEALVAALEAMLPVVSAPGFTIETQFEDIHSKIEHELIAQLGDAGKKIHTARSRNDQVLVAMHLYLKKTNCKLLEICVWHYLTVLCKPLPNIKMWLYPDIPIYKWLCPHRLDSGFLLMPKV